MIELSSLLPDRVRLCCRGVRARIASLGLMPVYPVGLSDEELHASESISIIVAVHDAPLCTKRCLNSLQAFSGKAEVIVVDDGSKLESTRIVLDEVCSRNRWKLIRNSVATGHSRASETGASASNKAIICLLNSDTVVTQRSWLGIIKAFASSDRVVVVGPSTSLTPTPQRVVRAGYCRHYWTDGQICGFAETYVNEHLTDPVIDLPYAGGFAFFIRRSTWEEFQGFDKCLPDYGNEKELCQRITQVGLRVVWTRGSYIHHLGSESYQKTIGRLAIIERSELANAYMENKQK
jgi:hypothetical protein